MVLAKCVREKFLDSWQNIDPWMKDHGILFTTMFGIGQQLVHDRRKPQCCYYFHCPSKDYIATPDPINDDLNALDYTAWTKNPELQEQIHLTLSATFPNLQVIMTSDVFLRKTNLGNFDF